MKTLLISFLVAAMGQSLLAQWLDTSPVLAEGQKLEEAGKPREAFLKYLEIPGGDYAATTVGRKDPEFYKGLLVTEGKNLPPPRIKLIEGDLWLALGKKEEALACYREVVARIGKTPEQSWAQGYLPALYYPVEPTPVNARDHGSSARARVFISKWTPAEPFLFGPGSQRDNWLIRRFIALEAWEDASQEFARIWQVHIIKARGFLINIPDFKPDPGNRLIRREGFNGIGRDFALDYAAFIRQRQQTNASLDVLLTPLETMELGLDFDGPFGQPIATALPASFFEVTTHELLNSPYIRNGSAGVTAQEYLRLCFGEFRMANQEDRLIGKLHEWIAQGRNPVRRLLARILVQQGHLEGALSAELEYLERSQTDSVFAAQGRGHLYEEYQKNRQAIEAYEQAWVLLRDRPTGTVAAMLTDSVRADLFARLPRLYLAEGRTEEGLAANLRLLDQDQYRRGDLEALEPVARQFEALKRQAQFRDWAKKRLALDATNALVQAALYWVTDERKLCAEALARARQQKALNNWGLSKWMVRIRQAGPETYRLYSAPMLKANPQDTEVRVACAVIDDSPEGEESVRGLEPLLDLDRDALLSLNKMNFRQAPLRDHHDLAYRLMRLYEHGGQEDKLRQLGLRLARGERPFGDHDLNTYLYRGKNEMPEHANACLALAVAHADGADHQAELAKALEASPWTGAKAQLARRRQGPQPPGQPRPSFGWANSPQGTRLLASLEDVLCLAADDRYVYAGYPWGIAVLDREGQPVTRVALGQVVQALVVTNGVAWAGTPAGLFRVPRADWKVDHLPLGKKSSLAEQGSHPLPSLEGYLYGNDIQTLALDDDTLWIGVSGNVQWLNMRTLEWRSFSHDELKTERWGIYDRLLPEAEFVWADSPQTGLRRYRRATETWEEVPSPYPGQPVRLIGVIEGDLWVDAWLSNQRRHRPSLVDRQTLEIAPLQIPGEKPGQNPFNSGPVLFLGEYLQQSVFTVDEIGLPVWFIYDRAARQLRRANDLPNEIRARHDERSGPYLELDHGRRVWGKRASSMGVDNALEDWSTDPERTRDTGGLFVAGPGGPARRVSTQPFADVFDGPHVFKMAPEDPSPRSWLCTDAGLVVLDEADRVVRQFSRDDGLCANRITDGLFWENRGYFASGWGDSGGGLIALDLATQVFTSYHAADGLATDKVIQLDRHEGKLRLSYGLVGAPAGDQCHHLYSPTEFDPQTARFSPRGEPQLLSQNEASARLTARTTNRLTMPCLGGFVLAETRRGDKRYLCGTRGVVILTGEAAPALAPEPLTVRFLPSVQQRRRVEAHTRPRRFDSEEQLAAALNDPDPIYRAYVLEALMRDRRVEAAAALVVQKLDDPDVRVRSTAFVMVQRSRWDDARMVPLLRQRLADPDPQLSALAALELLNRGQEVEIARLVKIQDQLEQFGNVPFGGEASVGILVHSRPYYEAVAGMADEKVFALLMQKPICQQDYGIGTNVFARLGASLRRHPAAAQVLLQAYDRLPWWHRQTQFARDVFQSAGRVMLPRLHEALTSTNRIIRSNAARACGAIGDQSSVPLLFKALDLESGLSKASIVWALGELRVREALPVLAQLYFELLNDPGAGYRSGQADSLSVQQYEALRDTASIGRPDPERRPFLPHNREDLLKRKHIYEAIDKIGPELSQDFYRNLAIDATEEARQEAAAGLAAGPDEPTRNTLLRTLLADREPRVALRAAVSLHILGIEDGLPLIKEWREAPEIWKKEEFQHQLERIRDPEKLRLIQDSLH